MTGIRIRAYHPASGSIVHAEVYDQTGTAPRRSFQIIPDGMGEVVIIREGVWEVTQVVPDPMPDGRGTNRVCGSYVEPMDHCGCARCGHTLAEHVA